MTENGSNWLKSRRLGRSRLTTRGASGGCASTFKMTSTRRRRRIRRPAATVLRHIIAALLLARAVAVDAQESQSRQIVVEAEELPSAYGAPPDLSHGRISTLTKSYVLAPFSLEVEAGYAGSIFRHDSPLHLFRQEMEMGLPARFTIGLANELERVAGATRERSFTVEGRYALADWNKLPLNPAISAEYRFGLNPGSENSAEIALLVSHDFPHLVEWAMNVFVDREFGGRRSTSAGFAQSVELPVLLPEEQLEVGLEMQYRSGSESSELRRATKGLAIGPTLAWRPTSRARFDLSPLLGCSAHTPVLRVFAVFSLSLGRTTEAEAETPVSARGH